jgi:predicted glycoside hydrolase/deacetylase ChbG (UPF0249 family)
LPFQKRLIVNADDFGLHRSINSAIAQAHKAGIVTSTSLMPGPHIAPAFDHAIDLLRDIPTLEVGLHFSLVGAPGQPENYAAFLQAKLLGDFPSASIKNMLRLQLDTLLEQGVAVTHIDSHQHLHALPSIMRVVAEVASEYGIGAVRVPAEYGDYAGAGKKRVYSAKALALLSAWSKSELDRKKIKYTDHFAGMAVSGSLTPEKMLRLLRGLQPGDTEILCHPGADNLTLTDRFDWGYDWLSELISVTDQSVIDCLAEEDIQLITFSKMVKDDHGPADAG